MLMLQISRSETLYLIAQNQLSSISRNDILPTQKRPSFEVWKWYILLWISSQE